MSVRGPEIGTATQGIQVISRAVAILKTLKVADGGLSLGQIARRVDLPRSTVQRIVDALISERLVMTSAAEGGLRLGPEIRSLAAASSTDIAAVIRPFLAALSSKTRETVDLTELRYDHLVFIDQIIGSHRLRAAAMVGESFPLTTTANGKACLALLDEETARSLIEHELQASGRQAREQRALLDEIEEIRRQGFAYDIDEHSEGISAVGAAFRDLGRQIYAVSIPTPSHRFANDRQKLTDSLVATMGEIKSLLG